ncbi:MAG TPA: hypothetical protein GX014_06405 [Firmicutes bacterium]|jgi:hypothetical protein|nr:DUF6470 family protein [Bacillota bacterium]HHT43020.1 hypothetical protein [Bacillota bacterium]
MLQITTVYPRFSVEYHWPRAEIKQQVSQLQVKTYGPELEIDQRQSRAELGLPGLYHFSRQVRDEARSKTINAIGQIAAEGDEVVQRAGHFREEIIFADQARRRMDARIPELNIKAAPTTRPEIRFHYGQELDWNQGGVDIKHYVRPPTITWQLGGVYVDVRG